MNFEREKENLGERDRVIEHGKKEGNGSRGRGFVGEFLTKKQEDFMMRREDLGGEMQ